MKKERNPNEPDFFEITGATKHAPRILPGGAGNRAKRVTPSPRHNFKEIKEKLDATGKLDRDDFNNASDIGLFLDWYNAQSGSITQKKFNHIIKAISEEGADRIQYDLGMKRNILM